MITLAQSINTARELANSYLPDRFRTQTVRMRTTPTGTNGVSVKLRLARPYWNKRVFSRPIRWPESMSEVTPRIRVLCPVSSVSRDETAQYPGFLNMYRITMDSKKGVEPLIHY